jgi:hypothetical protein
MGIVYRILWGVSAAAVALLFASVAFFGIAYVALGPLVGTVIILGTLMLIQYPFMRMALRLRPEGPIGNSPDRKVGDDTIQ